MTKTPPMGVKAMEESTVEGIDRRTRETKNNTLTTISGIEQLRKEAREDLKTVNKRVDKIDQKIDNLTEVITDVRVEVAGSTKQNEVIIQMLAEQNKARERSGMMRMTAMTAEVEVSKTRAISEIEVEKTSKLATIEVKRKFALKVLGIVGAIATAIATGGYLSQCL